MDKNISFPLEKGSWNGHDIYSIRFVGTGENFIKFIESLVRDFNEPKFGYGGELWDEYEK